MSKQFKDEKDLVNMTLMEKVKFYLTLCLGTIATLSVFAFLFLVPFVVDPSITTIMADFDNNPVICKTSKHIYAEGISNCVWTSCKEGCTATTPRCHQIYVNYSHIPYKQYELGNMHSKDVSWVAENVKFYINTDGCGYPPRINCTEFALQYEINEDKLFPCYYSRRYPYERTVAQFNWNITLKNLILAIGVPNLLFIFSIGILSYWYCWPNIKDRRTPNILTTTYATFNSTGSDIGMRTIKQK